MCAHKFIAVPGSIVCEKIKAQLKIIGDAMCDLYSFVQGMIRRCNTIQKNFLSRKSKVAVQLKDRGAFIHCWRGIDLYLIILLRKKIERAGNKKQEKGLIHGVRIYSLLS